MLKYIKNDIMKTIIHSKNNIYKTLYFIFLNIFDVKILKFYAKIIEFSC